MRATDELRRLLDERGVPYVSAFTTGGHPHTSWRDEDYREVSAIDFGERKLRFHGDLTPAQAIAATLGPGTCHEVEDEDTGFIVCSECGAVHDVGYTSYYCWCCGRKVVPE